MARALAPDDIAGSIAFGGAGSANPGPANPGFDHPGRQRISFRAVNRSGTTVHDPGLQRHHLLPRQLLTERSLASLFDAVGCETIGYHDFRANGLLLPSDDRAAIRIGLPLHRGPHRRYNAMVLDRVGRIEAQWSRGRARDPAAAREEAVFRLLLVQRALRRRLLDPRRPPIMLNRRQLFSPTLDFTELDAMADALWGAAEWSQPPPLLSPGTCLNAAGVLF